MTNAAVDVFNWIDTKGGDEKSCWSWTGSMSGKDKDRAYFSYEGTRVAVHRLVCELVHGPLADGEWVLHSCDNSMCVNPFHMRKGSREENERDKYERDRAGMPVVVLREIRRLLVTGMTHKRVAEVCTEKFGIPVSRIYVTKVSLGYRRALNNGAERTAEEIASGLLGYDGENHDEEDEHLRSEEDQG